MTTKLPWLFVAIVALIAIGLGWQQWRTASELSARVANLSAEVQKRNNALDEQAALIASLRAENEAYGRESMTLRKKLASLRNSSSATIAKPAATNSSRPLLAESLHQLFATMGKASENEATRNRQTTLIKNIYSDFASSRGLSEERTERFFELLIKKGLIQSDDGDNFMKGDGEHGENEAENAQSAAQQIAEIDRETQLLLGPASYADFQEYNKTAGERMVASQLQRQFGDAPALDEQQQASLLQVMIEERSKTPPSPLAPADASPRQQLGEFFASPNQEQLYQAEAELNERIANRMGGILETSQLDALKSAMKKQLDQEKFMTEMARVVFDAKTEAANPQP
ncbi:MAG: hypothetical protein M3Y86_04110 [Verrucomicrobiota bacterium]|nr:hypothetical protein [Verrucomicrobiota bacterium]